MADRFVLNRGRTPKGLHAPTHLRAACWSHRQDRPSGILAPRGQGLCLHSRQAVLRLASRRAALWEFSFIGSSLSVVAGGLGLPPVGEYGSVQTPLGSTEGTGVSKSASSGHLPCARFPVRSWGEAASRRGDRLRGVGSTSGPERETDTLEKAGAERAGGSW